MNDTEERLSVGVKQIDAILDGGLISHRGYIVRGGPGSGKTTLGLHFLTAEPGCRSLFISLGESAAQIRQDAGRQGFDLSGVHIADFSKTGDSLEGIEPYSIMSPADVEELDFSSKIKAVVEECRPDRIFIDSLTHLYYLAPDLYQYRKQVMTLLRFLSAQGATVLCAAEGAETSRGDEELRFLADGVIELMRRGTRRTIAVTKFRGSGFASGEHTVRLGPNGMECFQRLLPSKHSQPFVQEEIESGVDEIDWQLKGGLTRGTATIITGPSGVGKTTLGLQFMKRASERGERSVIYCFEENGDTLLKRAQGINIPMQEMVEAGFLQIDSMEPLSLSPDEFTRHVRDEVEKNGARVVMIDSLAGYRLAVEGGDFVQRLHAVCRYLKSMGVTTILVNEVDSITGGQVRATDLGVSYLADTVILLRYMEMQGEIRKTIGVLKKRTGDFEKSLREFSITKDGIKVGEKLSRLRGILRGDPEQLDDQPRPGV